MTKHKTKARVNEFLKDLALISRQAFDHYSGEGLDDKQAAQAADRCVDSYLRGLTDSGGC